MCADSLMKHFENDLMISLKSRLVSQAVKSYSKSIDAGNRVTILVNEYLTEHLKRKLIKSIGTVIVVPHTVSTEKNAL